MSISTVVAAVKAAVEAGIKLAPLVKDMAKTFKPGAPPPSEEKFAEWEALEQKLSDQLQAPMPEEQP